MNLSNILTRKNRILLKELVKTDFKLRYQGSILGYLWAVLRPLLMFSILYLVFEKILKLGKDIPHYPVYLLTGTVLWSFFTECTSQGIQSIMSRGELMRKISFPKYIVVLSSTATALINLLINLSLVLVFALISGVWIGPEALLAILPIVELYILSLGISLLLGAINVTFRDIASIWEVFVQALFYAIPIIYPIAMVEEKSGWVANVLLLNPIAQIIQDVRYLLITNESITTWGSLNNFMFKLIPIIIVISVFTLGAFYFSKKSKKFAEEI